ncbi:hypothetical protein [Methylobacterium fujisawaense]|jgi:hypothetical protein
MHHTTSHMILHVFARSVLVGCVLLLAGVRTQASEYKSICYDEGNYQVFARDRYAAAGMDIFFRAKKHDENMDNCDWSARKGDIWISENRGKYSEDANYVVGVRGTYVLIDSGTAPHPGRSFIAYDMKSRKRVLEKQVSEEAGIGDSAVTLWIPTGASNIGACSNRKEIEAQIPRNESASGETIRQTRKHLFETKTGVLQSTQDTKCFLEW